MEGDFFVRTLGISVRKSFMRDPIVPIFFQCLQYIKNEVIY